MKITSKPVHTDWTEFSLMNDNGMIVRLLDFGGIIREIRVPDHYGTMENVVLGYKHIADYAKNPNYFGAIIGRTAGRIKNASFSVNGKAYTLDNNEGSNHLHGGSNGFSHCIWKASPFETDQTAGVVLTHTSPGGESGYPGTISAEVTYTLNNQNQLAVHYQAHTDESTPFTMTNHSYFNLSGNLKDTVHHHHVTIPSNHYLELTKSLIPTGNILEGTNTPFDFQSGRFLQDGILNGSEQNKLVGNGYDHYFLFHDDSSHSIHVTDNKSGRTLTIETDQPGVVLYTANGLDNSLELNNTQSRQYLGVCFETQGSPASLHHHELPGIMLEAGNHYVQKTAFTFGID